MFCTTYTPVYIQAFSFRNMSSANHYKHLYRVGNNKNLSANQKMFVFQTYFNFRGFEYRTRTSSSASSDSCSLPRPRTSRSNVLFYLNILLLIIKCWSHTKKMRYCLLISDKYNLANLTNTFTQLEMKYCTFCSVDLLIIYLIYT